MHNFTTLALAALLIAASSALAQDAAPHPGANFDAQRKQANEMFLRGDRLQALPLYTDLERQDPTIAVFAERRGSGLIAAADLESDPAKSRALHAQAMAEMRRAQKLGDDSDLVRTMLGMEEDRERASRAPASTPPDRTTQPPGYRMKSANAEANRLFNEAESAFAKNDNAASLAGFSKAATLDPTFYLARLYAGDACFRGNDFPCAIEWYQKAIALDPNRETAFRYWGDALYRSGRSAEARLKYEQAIVAEPYMRLSWGGLTQWAGATHTQMGSPPILRPAITLSGEGAKITMPQGAPADTPVWAAYAGCRTDADHTRPTGSRRTANEELHCLEVAALVADQAPSPDFSPGVRALLSLRRDHMLECWLLLNGADQDVLHDYPAYRDGHRDLLVAYIDKYVVHQENGPATQRPSLQVTNPNQ